MKQTLVLSAVFLVFLVRSLEAAPEAVDISKLTDEQKKALQVLDSVDVDEELKDKDGVDKYIACVLEEATCDEDEIFESIKVLLPLRVKADDCIGCTAEQRGKMIKVAKFIKYNLRNRYDQIIEKFGDGVERPELAAL